MIKLKHVEKLMNNVHLKRIEQNIAKKTGCELYKENLKLIMGFTVEEIIASGLTIEEIQNFIEKNPRLIEDFGFKFLKHFDAKVLSPGTAITYSIYLIFLEKTTKQEFLDYLKRRKIPNQRELLNTILEVKEEMIF